LCKKDTAVFIKLTQRVDPRLSLMNAEYRAYM